MTQKLAEKKFVYIPMQFFRSLALRRSPYIKALSVSAGKYVEFRSVSVTAAFLKDLLYSFDLRYEMPAWRSHL